MWLHCSQERCRLIGRALLAAFEAESAATRSVRQSSRPPPEPRPLPVKQPWKTCVLVCVPGRSPPTPLPPPLGMMGGTLSTAALNWDKEFQGNLPFTASGSPPRGAAGTGSPPGTCLPPCLWKIYGCLRPPWYLNTTNDGGAFARSRLERRRWRQQCL